MNRYLTSVIILLLALTATGLQGRCGLPASVAFLGDSNTWTGGDGCTGPQAWSYHLVRNLLPRDCRSFARSGATWTNNSATSVSPGFYSEVLHDDNVIYNQALRLIMAVDSGAFTSPGYIFIMGGTNDAWFADRRPGIWSESVEAVCNRQFDTNMQPAEATSLAASARLVLRLLRDRFPQARILVLTPPFTVKASAADIIKVAETLQQVAVRENVYCMRLERISGIDPEKEAMKPYLTTDGTHTSRTGAWQIANCVYNFMVYNNWI